MNTDQPPQDRPPLPTWSRVVIGCELATIVGYIGQAQSMAAGGFSFGQQFALNLDKVLVALVALVAIWRNLPWAPKAVVVAAVVVGVPLLGTLQLWVAAFAYRGAPGAALSDFSLPLSQLAQAVALVVALTRLYPRGPAA